MFRILRKISFLLCLFFSLSCIKTDNPAQDNFTVTLKDSLNREVKIPRDVSGIICSGAGALRYICYMQCQDKVIAVDDIEKEHSPFDVRPYAVANPQFQDLPLFGEFRGNDNPELIMALQPQPELIFKTYGTMGYDPVELQEKTGIPVIVFEYGDLGANRQIFYAALDLIGKALHREKRAAEIKEYIDGIIADLDARTRNIRECKSCYIGGVSYRGALGLQSTEPGYPPFLFLSITNAAVAPQNSELTHMDVSREKIVEWDPQIIFIDLATLQSDPRANALYELKTDPAYRKLRAVISGDIYGVLPYNWYTQNHGSTLANAYYIGKILYPDKFSDIDPAVKADEIYTFLTGKPVFKEINGFFNHLVYQRLEL